MLELKPERFHLLLEAASQAVSVCGKPFIADSSGALYCKGEKTLLVADLHLEKASSYATRGSLVPPYDTRDTLTKLAEAIDRYGPERVVALGDSFHDTDGPARLADADLMILQMLQEDRDWIWITGNHDPEIAKEAGGRACTEYTVAGITLRHKPATSGVTHEIAGHMHPAARLSMYGYSLRRPCFVGNGRRIVMPAFGAFTGGLNVLDDAFEPLFGNGGMAVWMLGREGLYPVAPRFLAHD